MPDVENLIPAAKELVKKKFNVLPYCNDDPLVCRKLEDVGCSAVMPLAAPIGSGMGIQNQQNIKLIVDESKVPVIIDAGVGTSSDVAIAMELGCDGVLLNTAVAEAQDPELMAKAMAGAIESGRNAFLAGRIPKRSFAKNSTTNKGRIHLIKKN